MGTRADLNGVKLTGPLSLSGSDFAYSKMKKALLTDILNVNNANFSSADMDMSTLRDMGESLNANFDNAILSGASITAALFMGTSTFRGTNFISAKVEIFECDGCVFSNKTKFSGKRPRDGFGQRQDGWGRHVWTQAK